MTMELKLFNYSKQVNYVHGIFTWLPTVYSECFSLTEMEYLIN
jgi:hypothetical protein